MSLAGVVLAAGLMAPLQKAPQAKKPVSGEAVWKAKCASCHGAKGQGGPGFNKPLTGTRSEMELASFIGASMPPGGPKLPKAEATAVSNFVHAQFYSTIAQERTKPPRLELSRLTVRQFRNVVSDLVGSWHPVVPNTAERGLSAEYFKSRYFDGNKRGFNRNDATVKFDFGTEGPTKEFDPYQFAIIWNGSLLAPDSGEYEIVVRSDQAFKLYLNNPRKPLIDAWVRSNTDFEFVASATLLGGRAYPIRIEFSKSTQGVADQNKDKQKPPAKASIELQWRRPRRVRETIPTRFLFPQSIAPTFVLEAKMPPDDRSMGFERGAGVSKEWDDAFTSAVIEVADYVAGNFTSLTGVPEGAPDRKDRSKQVLKDFVERAFRRPLTPEAEKLYITRQFDEGVDFEQSIKKVVILALKSPRFYLRESGDSAKDAYGIASQLSFGLWDTIPDPELVSAARQGRLTSRDQINAQAERLASDPRSWTKLREFLMLWLKIDEVPDLIKSGKQYPDFDAAVASDLRSSLELFLEKTAWGQASDYRQLMQSNSIDMNGRLAKIYGVALPADAPFQEVQLDPKERAGVLTHPYMLSRLAYLEASSPIHRGVLIARNMLGRTLAPPPVAVAPVAPGLHPGLTTRERVAAQTKPAMCDTCHAMINPLGFSLEKFDAIGRLRAKDNGKPIVSTGSYLNRSGKKITFDGPAELAAFLAGSDEAHHAFVEKLFLHLVKQAPLAYGPKTLPKLKDEFVKDEFSIRKLMVDVMVETAAPK